MSGISLQYHIDIEQPIRALNALGRADRRELLEDVAEIVMAETQINFDQEQAPDGTPWTPSQREGKTLTDRGHLRDSITYLVGLDAESVEIGSAMEYAAIHQFGGQAGRNHAVEIEARPYLGLTSDMQDEIGDLVIDFYDEVLSRVH